MVLGGGEEDMLVLTRTEGGCDAYAADDATSDDVPKAPRVPLPETVGKARAAEQRDAALVSRKSILRVATGLGMGGAEEREKNERDAVLVAGGPDFTCSSSHLFLLHCLPGREDGEGRGQIAALKDVRFVP